MASTKAAGHARVALAALILPRPVDAQALARDSLKAVFVDTAKSARPLPRRWWTGDAVTDAELHRQVFLFDAVGMGGSAIRSFNPGITGLTQSRLGSVNNYAGHPRPRRVRKGRGTRRARTTVNTQGALLRSAPRARGRLF